MFNQDRVLSKNEEGARMYFIFGICEQTMRWENGIRQDDSDLTS
jgi:hypothetical protein